MSTTRDPVHSQAHICFSLSLAQVEYFTQAAVTALLHRPCPFSHTLSLSLLQLNTSSDE